MDGIGFGNPERGWNDPPKLAFNPTGTGTAAGPGRHRLLNKRVPIPLNPQSASSSPPGPPLPKGSDAPPPKTGIPLHPPSSAPRPPPCSVSSSPPTAATTTTTTCDDAPALTEPVPSQELLDQAESRLSECLKSISEKVKEETSEEIRRRLTVMAEMWRQEQLTAEVQKRMVALSEALGQKDYEKAWAVHQGLIVDYTTTCTPWMVGVKTLIAELRTHAEDTVNAEERPETSSKDLEGEANVGLDDSKEETSVGSVSPEK